MQRGEGDDLVSFLMEHAKLLGFVKRWRKQHREREQLESLLLPQAAQARGGPQLPGFGLLAAGNGQGLLEAGFGLGCIRDGLAQEELALEPIRLREHVALPVCLERRQGLGQQAQPLRDMAGMPRRLGEQD